MDENKVTDTMDGESFFKGQPNILWIMADQHKATALSCLGEEALKKDLTPNLDSLAADGILFPNAYCPSPVCGPARAAMKTGKYPPATGMVKNLRPLRENNAYLPALLRDSGYETGMAGKLHLFPADRDYGFEVRHLSDAPYSVYGNEDKYSEYIKWLRDNYFDAKGIDPVKIFDEDEASYDEDIKRFMMGSCFREEEEHETAWTTKRTLEFLENRDQKRPFFFYTSYFGPHQPYGVPKPYADYYSPEDITLPESFYQEYREKLPLFQENCGVLYHHLRDSLSEADCRELIAAYLNQVRMIDAYVGKLLRCLKEKGLYDKTMIIYSSDHGENLGEHGLFFKSQMYDSCAKVPLIIKPAAYGDCGAGEPPCQRQEIVNTVDLFATVLETAGLDWQSLAAATPDIESRSMKELLYRGKAGEAVGRKTNWENRTYSIVGFQRDKALCMLREGDWKLIRLAHGPQEAIYELYHMTEDPKEMEDLYPGRKEDALVKQMKERLDCWFRRQYANYPVTV